MTPEKIQKNQKKKKKNKCSQRKIRKWPSNCWNVARCDWCQNYIITHLVLLLFLFQWNPNLCRRIQYFGNRHCRKTICYIESWICSEVCFTAYAIVWNNNRTGYLLCDYFFPENKTLLGFSWNKEPWDQFIADQSFIFPW